MKLNLRHYPIAEIIMCLKDVQRMKGCFGEPLHLQTKYIIAVQSRWCIIHFWTSGFRIHEDAWTDEVEIDKDQKTNYASADADGDFR